MATTLTVKRDTRITEAEDAELVRLAERHDRSVAAMIRRAIRQLLNERDTTAVLQAVEDDYRHGNLSDRTLDAYERLLEKHRG